MNSTEQDKRELVIAQARRYKEVTLRWEALSRLDPSAAMRLWREVEAAERDLFRALDALDETGAT
jgi:hypothetical protein